MLSKPLLINYWLQLMNPDWEIAHWFDAIATFVSVLMQCCWNVCVDFQTIHVYSFAMAILLNQHCVIHPRPVPPHKYYIRIHTQNIAIILVSVHSLRANRERLECCIQWVFGLPKLVNRRSVYTAFCAAAATKSLVYSQHSMCRNMRRDQLAQLVEIEQFKYSWMYV